MNHPDPPLTAAQVQAMIDEAIDKHTREWIWASSGGGMAFVALLLWALIK